MGTQDRDEPLFTRPEPDEDEGGSTPLGELGLGLAFLAGAVAVYLLWDSLALPEDSLAGGKRAGLRRLLGQIGQLPVTLVLATVGVLVLGLAAHSWLTRDKDA